jgi:hypothetical protein
MSALSLALEVLAWLAFGLLVARLWGRWIDREERELDEHGYRKENV